MKKWINMQIIIMAVVFLIVLLMAIAGNGGIALLVALAGVGIAFAINLKEPYGK